MLDWDTRQALERGLAGFCEECGEVVAYEELTEGFCEECIIETHNILHGIEENE